MASLESTTPSDVGFPGHGDYPQLELLYFLVTNYLWLAPVCLGLPGNLIAMMVTTMKHNRSLSPCVYMTAMAVADSVVLLNNVWYHPVIMMGLGDDIKDVASRKLMLQFCWYFAYTGGVTSGLFLTEMSVDRLLAVAFPMKAKTLCTTSRALKTVSVTAVSIVLINLNIFFTHDYVKNVFGSEVLVVRFPELDIIETLASGFQLIFGTVIPFVIIFCCNIGIIILLHRANKARGKLANSQSKPDEKNDTKYLTRMLIMVSVVYLFTSIPYRMFSFLTDVPAIGNRYNMKETYWSLRFSVENYLLGLIWFFNYAVNFYLYCIGGGKRYRRDAKVILRPLCPCLKKKNVDV